MSNLIVSLLIIAILFFIFRKIVCFFRNHNWGAWSNWKYKSINSCERQRVCLRCKKKEVKEEKHVWGTWEYVANSCKQRRKCQQCQHSEIQITEHLWDVWKYISSDVCQQISVCQRCKTENKEKFRIEHAWGTWKYITQNSCQQEMICQRCGEKKSRTAKHIWGAWDDWKKISYSSCQQIRICERCKETENQIEKHLWNKWKYISLNSCEQEKTCQRCRTRNTRIGKHLWNEWEYISPNSCEQEKTCQRCKTKDSQIGEHLWNEWEYISLNSCKQEKICQQCGAKDTRHVEEYQRVIRTITETILDELAHFNDNFHIESPSARDVFADPDISSYSTLSQIQQEVYRAQFQLQEEPFVAYIKAEIDGQEKILFICRTYTPTELKPLTPLATFVSSRSPMGRIASYEVGNIDIINTPQGRVKVKVIEKNLFKPVKSGLKWDGKENKFSLKSGSYFIKSLVDLAAKEGIKRESIDDFALRDMAILDRTQSDIYTLSNLAIKNGIGRESIDDFALRDMAILDRTQGEIYTLPLSYQIIIEGAPGTGKTTTLIKRIAQKSIPEQNFLHEDDIRRLDRENEMEFFFNKNNWIMFTPTEALKFFLKKALSKELLPNSDNLVRTWDVEQTSLATDVLNIVKYKDKGFYTRATKKIINAQNNSDLINYAEQFIKFSNAVISNSIQGQVKRAKYINMCVTKIPRQYHSFRLKQLKQAESLLNKQYSQEIKNKEISDQEIDLLIFVMLKNAHEKIFKHRIYKELLNDNLKVLDRIDVLENIKAKYKTQVIVDEATDFSTVQLGCMTYLAHPRYRSVIFAGDLIQRVTALGLSNWEEFRDLVDSSNKCNSH